MCGSFISYSNILRTNPADAITLVRDDALGLYGSPFDSKKKTVFLIHGWTNDANHQWMTTSVSEILINVRIIHHSYIFLYEFKKNCFLGYRRM